MKIVWLFLVVSLSDSGLQRFSDSTSQQIPGKELNPNKDHQVHVKELAILL